MTTNYTTKLKNKRIISINGDESDIFLNNIITNDIKKIDNNSAIYSCLLTPQGKVISHFFIVKNNVEILVIIDDYLADEFIEKLNVYKLRSNVEINLKNEYEIIFSLSDNLKIKSIIEFNDPRNK
jgi:folate-binding Fe-S cluster repair protein YgfZ